MKQRAPTASRLTALAVAFATLTAAGLSPASALAQAAGAAATETDGPTGTPVNGSVVARFDDKLRIELESGSLTPAPGDLVTITWAIEGHVLDGGRAEVTEVSEGTVTARITDGKPNSGMDATIWVMGPEDAFRAGEAIFLADEPDDRDQRRAMRREAADWYLKAATAGHQGARDRLIEMWALRRGPGIHRDIIVLEAEEIFVEAARNGSATAQFALGRTFIYGSESAGIPARPAEAVGWFRLAAAQGHAEAMEWLGAAYQHARGVERDHVRAQALYQEAIDAGSIDALHSMARLLYTGRYNGIPISSRKEAFKMLKRAAEAGQCLAIEELGLAYIDGTWITFKVKKDEKKGLRMLKEGARAGCPTVKYELKQMGERW